MPDGERDSRGMRSALRDTPWLLLREGKCLGAVGALFLGRTSPIDRRDYSPPIAAYPPGKKLWILFVVSSKQTYVEVASNC